jgi:hypothetical protein
VKKVIIRCATDRNLSQVIRRKSLKIEQSHANINVSTAGRENQLKNPITNLQEAEPKMKKTDFKKKK